MASTDVEAGQTELRQQLEAAQNSVHHWQWALGIVTAAYVFIYIMGRRRLMRKIWKRNRQLRTALEQANEASRMKAAFIRSMSHEVRTPLNAINGFSQLLCSPDVELSEEEKSDMRNRISQSVDMITEIINELLELSQGETREDLRSDDVHPNEVCKAVMEMAQPKNTNQLELRFETTLADDFNIKSNRDVVSQILQKIMDNALKFTDQGSVVMACSHHDGQLEISVTDTGVGIPKEKRAAVFENFVKLDDYKGGVGLGLPICRRLARSLGGDISLDPEYTTGSRFVLQLPV